MIRDIENKSKKELIEMLEIAQHEYQKLHKEYKQLMNNLPDKEYWEKLHNEMYKGVVGDKDHWINRMESDDDD